MPAGSEVVAVQPATPSLTSIVAVVEAVQAYTVTV